MTVNRLCAAVVLILALFTSATTKGADNLRLNPKLNFKKNNHQGQLIFGDNLHDVTKPGMVNYIVFYAEFCYNAKRQARTTVDLYNQYRNRVHFVLVDFEYGWTWEQNKLVLKYFAGNIPQIVILDAKGRPVFNYIGQSPEATLASWLNAALKRPQTLALADHPMDHPGEAYTDEITHNPFEIIKDHLGH
jgi:hypothetical protein